MEKLHFKYQATQPIDHPVHIGVVASGDLEVIMKPTDKKRVRAEYCDRQRRF